MGDDLEKENVKLRKSLESLNEILRDKFEIVKLNEEGKQAIEDLKAKEGMISVLEKKLQEESQRYEELSEKFDHFQTEAEFERGNARNEIQRFKDIATELEDQLKTWVDRYEKLKQSMANFETTLEEKERDIAAKAATVRVLNVSNKLRQVVAVSKSNEIKDLKTEVTAKESEKTKIVNEMEDLLQKERETAELQIRAKEDEALQIRSEMEEVTRRLEEEKAMILAQKEEAEKKEKKAREKEKKRKEEEERSSKRQANKGGKSPERHSHSERDGTLSPHGGVGMSISVGMRSHASGDDYPVAGLTMEGERDYMDIDLLAANQHTNGMSRLRGMLAQRRPGSGGATGLDSDNIRNLLRTTRAILNERSAAERAPPFNDGLSRILPLPEYIYVWFASNHKGAQSTGAMRGVMADAECGRFLDTLERYRDKSKELAAFWYLVDACEPDEVAYYLHARSALNSALPPRPLTTAPMEVSIDLAHECCMDMVMRHAHDEHARTVRASVSNAIVNKQGVVLRQGWTCDLDGLLTSLLAVYREEKGQAMEVLSTLWASSGKSVAYGMGSGSELPAAQRVSAVLRSIDPSTTEAQAMHAYMRSRTHPRKRDASEREQAVSLKLLWAAIQREGFLVRRQRLTAPTFLGAHDPQTRKISEGGINLWMSLRPSVQRMMGRMSGSNSDVDREWASALQRTYDMTELAYNQIPASQSLLPRIRRLFWEVYQWQSYSLERPPPPNTRGDAAPTSLGGDQLKPSESLRDLTNLASLVAQRGGPAGLILTSGHDVPKEPSRSIGIKIPQHPVRMQGSVGGLGISGLSNTAGGSAVHAVASLSRRPRSQSAERNSVGGGLGRSRSSSRLGGPTTARRHGGSRENAPIVERQSSVSDLTGKKKGGANRPVSAPPIMPDAAGFAPWGVVDTFGTMVPSTPEGIASMLSR